VRSERLFNTFAAGIKVLQSHGTHLLQMTV
jgi:hypothetical protein